ncbi:helix-turn-helix transcriptional regulator [Paenibacillus sp. GYB003]|uniref:AraC family transcriptional regulator n=1 Tax=Paenibacillus sp. GYB003 TaxID=2994392 RepID=UPI002FA83815
MMEDREQHLESGSIHMIGQHIFHSFEPDPAIPGERSTFRFTFQDVPSADPGFPQEEADQIKAALSRLTYCRLTDPVRNRAMFRMLAEARTEIENQSVGSYSKVLSLFAQLIIELVRGIQTEHQTPPAAYTMPRKDKYDQWSRLIDAFFANCQKELTLEMLAETLNLSTKQTHRLLKKHFNTSFKHKLMHTRVEVAKDLLRTSKLSIERIAGEVGYSSTQYFCHLFQQKTGMTPSEYRYMELGEHTASIGN